MSGRPISGLNWGVLLELAREVFADPQQGGLLAFDVTPFLSHRTSGLCGAARASRPSW